MTDDAGAAAGSAGFQKSIQACRGDLDALLPELMQRYDATTVITALAQHVGSALQIMRSKKLCDDRQAGLIIARIENSAFGPDEPVQAL
jgi:hypothetical protein